ncbi:MAG: alpha-1,3-galactosidase-related protein [Bacteroidales bacterium]
MRTHIVIPVLLFASVLSARTHKFQMRDFGIKPNTTENISPLVVKALNDIKQEVRKGDKVELYFEKGAYNFHPEGSFQKEYYISNHDQDNPKSVGIALEQFNNVTLDGNGADFLFHGRMLPLSVIGDTSVVLRNFSVDFPNPHIAQVQIISNNPETGEVVYEIAPWVNYQIDANKNLVVSGEGWRHTPSWGIAFEEKTKRLVYNTSDIGLGTKNVEEISPRKIRSKSWKNEKLIPGTVVAMRGYGRPTPGVFVTHSKNVKLENIRMHYAEGMGLLAQMSENLTLDKFSVCLRGDNDPRYFTTQADATHFSACKGFIKSVNGLYEGMMDDAINVHGTYLNIKNQINPTTVEAAYMHPQAWGFEWGRPNDEVQFVSSKTMELFDGTNKVKSITPVDKPTVHGAKVFRIEFDKPLSFTVTKDQPVGIENLTWTPEVYFADNVIRNNRARGTLFSTPKKTIVERNYFDHTSGTAILLCGDCNGWYETGACREVIIRDNYFKNALTNMFQFTNAVISIYPEIPNLKDQKKYFHGGSKTGILIENNTFETFDEPLLYAKSINGLTFRKNKIVRNNDYPAFHWNKKPFLLERAIHVKIEKNSEPYSLNEDVKINDSDVNLIIVK